jgi:hypothetical protein
VKKLRIIDTIKVVREVPIDEEHYGFLITDPDMAKQFGPGDISEMAKRYEESSDPESRWEAIDMHAQNTDADDPNFQHVTTAEIINEDDNGPLASEDPTVDTFDKQPDPLGVEHDADVEFDSQGNLVEKLPS